VTGTLAANGLSMNGTWSYQENQGSGYNELTTGTFTATRTSQRTDDGMSVDFNTLFGNTGKSPLDIRVMFIVLPVLFQ